MKHDEDENTWKRDLRLFLRQVVWVLWILCAWQVVVLAHGRWGADGLTWSLITLPVATVVLPGYFAYAMDYWWPLDLECACLFLTVVCRWLAPLRN